MFTGIIETMGKVTSLSKVNGNLHLTIQSSISQELKVDQSVSHNGVCLTVIEAGPDGHKVVAIDETLNRSTIGSLRLNDSVNLERCLVMNGRLDGHIVQGHVDTRATCIKAEDQNGSWLFCFKYVAGSDLVTVPKGSICVDGVSLTVVDSQVDEFAVAIIPYTYENTSFKHLKEGTEVNLEFDIIGKYVARLLDLRK